MEQTYKKLLEIRNKSDLKIKKNSHLKDTVLLRSYQSQAVLHFYLLKCLVLGDDCGLGKSCVSLASYCALLEKQPDLKLVIIAPSSALYQWKGEVAKFCNDLTCQIVESVSIKVGKKRLTSYASREHQFEQFKTNNNNVLIFNYNTMCSDFHYLEPLFREHKMMLIFDEATAFKNLKSITYKYALELSKLANRKYALSATVIKNNLLEAYSIFSVIMPGLLGSLTTFKKNYCIIERQNLWKGKGKKGRVIHKIVGYKNLPHFKKAIDPFFLGRKKATVAKDLPEIISREVTLRLNSKQQALYNDALEGFLDFNKFDFQNIHDMMVEDNEDIKRIDKLTALIYCQQICNSPETLGYKAPSVKEEELLRLLEDELNEEKVVIYTRFKRVVNRLEELIEKKLNLKTVKITGDVSSEQRELNKQIFSESSDTNIILINSAAKEAVNLQKSGYLIFFDLPFSYGDFLQIIGRIHRIGSEYNQIFLIYLLCQDTIDEKTYNILKGKKELFDEILGDSAVGAIKVQPDLVNSLFNEVLEDAKERYKKK